MLERVSKAGIDADRSDGTALLRDPSGNVVRLLAR